MPEKLRPLRIFVSYSRADAAFADELAAGLELANFEVTIDRHSIIEGEDWRSRLGALIGDADTIVFLLSPDSAGSAVCQWEVDAAVKLSKRIIPVLVRRLGEISAPPALASINYVRFDPDDDGRARSMMASMKALVRALNTDVSWLREHTRLLARALEWDAASRPDSRLLLGQDIALAIEWLRGRPRNAPEPTELHHDFIRASESAEKARQSAERQRLDEVAKSQQVHAAQLAEREAQVQKYSRRSLLFFGGSVVAASVASVTAYQAFVWNREYRQVQTRRFRDAERADISGQLIAYATSPGGLSADGAGRHSPYCEALLSTLKQSDLSITQAILEAQHTMSRTPSDVQQVPFFSSSLNGEIFLQMKPKNRVVSTLVVGNCAYTHMSPLQNSINDSSAMAELLRAHSSTVTDLRDCSGDTFRSGFDRAIKTARMQSRIRVAGLLPVVKTPTRDSLFLMYFSGMGVMLDREVYLGMVDSGVPDFAKLQGRDHIAEMEKAGWIRLGGITDMLAREFRASVIMFDACLDDPRTGTATR
jgi:hypothetical protein